MDTKTEWSWRLFRTIDRDKPIESQLDALSQYDTITDEELSEIADTCFKSAEAAVLLQYLGFERVRAHALQFLEFLQDCNWPAVGGTAQMFVEAGREALPSIKQVLKGDDYIWNWCILRNIVLEFETDIVLELKEDLIDLIQRADGEGAASVALRILYEKQLVTEEESTYYYHYLLDKFVERSKENKFTSDSINWLLDEIEFVPKPNNHSS